MPLLLQFLFAASLGLTLGSFGTMLLDRLPKGESLTGRSRCPHCRSVLRPLDLIPVFSFFFVQGRCRSCGERIPWCYPSLEALTALVFALLFAKFHGEPAMLLFLGGASTALLLIAFHDFASQRIPDVFVATLFLGALGAASVRSLTDPLALRDSFIGVAIPLSFFGSLSLLSNGRWIGSGDILLGASIGLLLGVRGTLTALLIAYTLGASVASCLILARRVRVGESRTIAFGPFLSAGTLLALLLGEVLFTQYQMLFSA